MYAFIDESGDPGFKLGKGSSPVFVVAMAMFANAEGARRADEVIADAATRIGVKPEIKFGKIKDSYLDVLFEAVTPCNFKARAIVVAKEKIYSQALRETKESFYKFFVRMMMQ